jgi:Spy/CpxP family protein refolding chaperone
MTDTGIEAAPMARFIALLDQLDLTVPQKTQVRALFDQAKPQLQAVHESGRANREQLVVTPPTDPAYAGQLEFAKSNALEQIQLMSDLWSRIYAILTTDQRAQIPGIVATERSKRDAGRASWRQQRDGE